MSDVEDLDSDIDEGMDLDAAGNVSDELSAESDDADSDGGEDDSDDDDDSDGEEDDDAKLMKLYLEILGKINEDKYNYDNYVQLVDVAHQISDLDKIRQSCEIFSNVYPLAPHIWLRWLKIESNISTSEIECQAVQELFQRAFADYFCSTLAAEYANLASKSPNANVIWDEIISSYALHCTKGRPLFEAWRVYFENTEPESSEKHAKLIEMYERELSIPLFDMEETYIELKLLCEKNKEKFADVDWPRIDEKYNRAKESLQKMLPFEKQLDELPPQNHQDRASTYQKYIAECKSFLNEEIVQVLYERMVTDCCLNENCWLEYVKYLQRRQDLSPAKDIAASPVFRQSDWDVLNRAIRNCTWSAKLYIEKLRIAEKLELNKQQLQSFFEQALAAGFNTPEPLVSIWLEYLSYLRRNTNFTIDKEAEILRANFTLAWDSLGRQFGVLADSQCEILQFWGCLEYGPLYDLQKGKELWTTVMESADNANKSGLWIEFAQLELKRSVDSARKVYRKAIASPEIDNVEVIASAWTRFERCNGTLEQLKACQVYCAQYQHQSAYKKPWNSNKKISQPKGKNPFNKDGGKKSNAGDKGKRGKDTRPTADGDKDAVFVIKKHKRDDTDTPVPQKRQKLSSGSARNTQSGNFAPQNTDPTSDPAKDNVTVFLSNLSFDLTPEEIKAAFPELHVQSVSLVRGSTGKSRGFAYLEVLSPREHKLALSFDRRMISGRPVFISNIQRDKEKRGVFKYAEALEPTKLFIKGLPHDATKEELEQLFGEFGSLKDTRLVCHKNGNSKGIAYVEFEQESSASRAVLKMDQSVLRENTMTVAISAPPPKPKHDTAAQNQVGLGQGRRTNIHKGDQKPRLSFIPRSVQKAVQNNKNGHASGSAVAPKSNDDFRQLLQK